MDHTINPDKKLCAVCGLFCPACSIYIATHEDPERLKKLAENFSLGPEELKCDGCRAERRIYFCRDKCKMTKCAAEKGIDFCSECEEFPCAELKQFQAARPHRIELWDSLRRIEETGWEKWFEEMIDLYSCGCGTLNSAYDLGCRVCGTEPSCKYVELHSNEIIKDMPGKLKT